MKDTIRRMKRQATIWEEIFIIHISDKGIVSKIYKEISNSTIRKQPTNKTMDKIFEDIAPKKIDR